MNAQIDTQTDDLLTLILTGTPSRHQSESIRLLALDLVKARAASAAKTSVITFNTNSVAPGKLLPFGEYRKFMTQFIGMGKINAIKHLRSQVKCGLLEAKQFIEAACTFTNSVDPHEVRKVTGMSTLHIKLPEEYFP